VRFGRLVTEPFQEFGCIQKVPFSTFDSRVDELTGDWLVERIPVTLPECTRCGFVRLGPAVAVEVKNPDVVLGFQPSQVRIERA
jgi:hypothetical protein